MIRSWKTGCGEKSGKLECELHEHSGEGGRDRHGLVCLNQLSGSCAVLR